MLYPNTQDIPHFSKLLHAHGEVMTELSVAYNVSQAREPETLAGLFQADLPYLTSFAIEVNSSPKSRVDDYVFETLHTHCQYPALQTLVFRSRSRAVSRREAHLLCDTQKFPSLKSITAISGSCLRDHTPHPDQSAVAGAVKFAYHCDRCEGYI